MAGLGLLGAAIVGGVGGLAKGTGELANLYIDREGELLKEQRTQEAKAREAQSGFQYQQMGEDAKMKRGLLDHIAKKKADLVLSTDPGNVAAVTEAELARQRKIDQYGDERFPTKAEQARALHEANNPYEADKYKNEALKQQAALEKTMAQLDYWGKTAANAETRNRIDALKAQADLVQADLEAVSKAEPTTDAEILANNQRRLAAQANLDKLNAAMMALSGGGDVAQPANGQQDKYGFDAEMRPNPDTDSKPGAGQPIKAEEKPKGMVPTASQRKPGEGEKPIRVKASGMLVDNDMRLVESAKAFLKYGPSGSKHDVALTRIRNDKSLSDQQKVAKIVDYLKQAEGEGTTDSIKSILGDYGQLLGL